MAGYFVFDLEIFDQEAFDEYTGVARALLDQYGASIVINSANIEHIEGDWKPSSIVVAKFPSMDIAREFYNSKEYRDVVGLRDRSARSRGILLESQ